MAGGGGALVGGGTNHPTVNRGQPIRISVQSSPVQLKGNGDAIRRAAQCLVDGWLVVTEYEELRSITKVTYRHGTQHGTWNM